MYQYINKIAMNDIRTLTIDEFNKQLNQPTLHPEVAVIDPARLADDSYQNDVAKGIAYGILASLDRG